MAGRSRDQFDLIGQLVIHRAELVNIPNEQLLRIYQALHPPRSTYQELISLSEELAVQYDAVENARFIREAVEAYRTNMLLRPEDD